MFLEEKMKKLALLVAAIALTLSACGTSPETTHTTNDASASISAAETANKQAKKVNYEWRDTGKIIKKAKKAQKDGNYSMAVKLADKAKRQAQQAYKQYLEQRNAKPKLG